MNEEKKRRRDFQKRTIAKLKHIVADLELGDLEAIELDQENVKPIEAYYEECGKGKKQVLRYSVTVIFTTVNHAPK